MSNNPYRRPNPPPTFAQHPNPHDDLTWLDFLRTAGGTVPNNDPRPQYLARTDSAERKRRHTGSEPHRPSRPHPTPTYIARHPELRPPSSSSLQHGASRENAIDLTSPSRLARPSFARMQGSDGNNSSSAGRRESDISLPKWQPDHEASQCPVCHTEFGMFYRRHHCRKCGRVVCSTCSPHRITIPRQYIVQPPNPFYDDDANPPDFGRDNPTLGGGEIVRVCNPCVPDPWTPNVNPTAASIDNNTAAAGSSNDASSQLFPRTGAEQIGSVAGRDIVGNRDFSRYAGRRDRSQTYQDSSALSRDPRLAPPRMSSSIQSREHDDPFLQLANRMRHRHTQSGGDRAIPIPPPFTHRATNYPSRPPPPIPTGTPSSASPARTHERPRREVKEEDECPVCGTEMPPGEAVREAHIQECIAARFSSTPSQPPPSAPPAAETVTPIPSSLPSSAPVQAASSTPEGSRPRATSYRPRGMALYRATEKDCTTEEGEPQECVICFEEFEEGDEMGRMECLCKFHRACIRQWWNTKGQGSCPTHQLHD